MKLPMIALAAFAAATAVPAAAGDVTRPVELTLTGGFSSAPGSGRDATTGAGLEVGTDFLRLTAGGTWTALHKYGTSGGYHVGGALGARLQFGGFSLGGGVTRSFADQTEWTKRVHYAYGAAAYRWTTRHRVRAGGRNLPKEFNEVQFAYFRETFSTYRNYTQHYRLSYAYDHRLGSGPAFVHLGLAIGEMRFHDNPYPDAKHRRGMTSHIFAGLSLRP